jgi:hypothetical protein
MRLPGPALLLWLVPAALPAQQASVRFPTSCAAAAQPRFERAVTMLHSFAFAGAVTEFNAAREADPGCAMASWGLALAAWGNPFAAGIKPAAQIERGLAAVQMARAAKPRTERERGYIEAVARLYDRADSLRQPVRLLAYRDAMAALVVREPADTEAAIFHALAQTVSADPGDKTYTNQLAAGATLERLAVAMPKHPGLTHYIIHAYDFPRLANKALAAADRYAEIAPGMSHALHMPSHTYTRVGAWQQSIAANRAAGEAAHREGAAAEHLHSTDYRAYAYLQLGQDKAARALLAEQPAIAARLDLTSISTGGAPAAGYYAIAAVPARYALERGAWSEAARLEVRQSPVPFAEAVTWFARGLGSARSRDTAAARAAVSELTRLGGLLNQQGESYWTEQVGIQRQATLAWLELASGRRSQALQEMRSAADREAATEKNAMTPGPLAPASELLGEMLLEVGEPNQALKAFEATLLREPNRFRATAGAARAAQAAGDRATARKYWQALLTLAAEADRPGRPELAQAEQFLRPQ